MDQTIIREMISNRTFKTIILDDDPTGTQTIFGYFVYTSYDDETIRQILTHKDSASFILTNSRALTRQETKMLHQQIARSIQKISDELHLRVQVISRSDSTLRQHYPIETESLAEDGSYDGELLIPALVNAGRVTKDDVHYEIRNGQYVRCDQTDYAKDKSFGYRSSNLKEWIEEKTDGKYRQEQISSIPLVWLHQKKIDLIQHELRQLQDFNKLIVNAETLEDLEVFVVALEPILLEKKLMIRTAASFVGVFLGCFQENIIAPKELLSDHHKKGGLVVIGSHVEKTTQQLQQLQELNDDFIMIEYDQHRVLDDELELETERVVRDVTSSIMNGKSVVVATRRDRLDFSGEHPDRQLELTQKIAYGLMQVVGRLDISPSYLIAKGGITSSDIATKALQAKRALVIGQAKTCVPVWKVEGGKFDELPYIIFPGNIGKDSDLRDLVKQLEEERK